MTPPVSVKQCRSDSSGGMLATSSCLTSLFLPMKFMMSVFGPEYKTMMAKIEDDIFEIYKVQISMFSSHCCNTLRVVEKGCSSM